MSQRTLGFLAAALLLAPSATFAQESLARIDAPIVIGDTQTRFQKLGDIDGDGYTDAFSVWWKNDAKTALRLDAWINDREGKLVRTWQRNPWLQPVGTSFWAVAAGDIDTNGFDDVVVGAGTILNLYLTEPGGTSQPQAGLWTTSGGAHIRGVALLNVDGDPEREIAVLHGDLTVLDYVPGSPNLLAPIAFLALGTTNGEVLAADLDFDGQRDLLVWDATHVRMVLVQSGVPQPPVAIFQHDCVDPRAQVGDIDGDGDEDVVVFDTTTYRVLRRVGTTTWVPEAPLVGGPARYLYDVDGDGDPDGVCCGGGGGGTSSVHNTVSSFFRVALNDGTGNYAPAISFPGLGSERLAGAADLDHDGDLDLVAGRCIYYMPDRVEDGAPRNVGVPSVHAGMFADFDSDGDPDLEPGTSVRRNAGDGTFAPFAPVLPTPPLSSEYQGTGYPGDFDGDGDVDLVVGMLTNGVFEHMRLLRNAGGGSFTDSGPAGPQGMQFSALASGASARESLARDADGDGDLDLVLGNEFSSVSSRIFWNDGGGLFSTGPSWPSFRITHVADFNADGFPDLFGHAYYGGGVSYRMVYGGLGGGAFNAGVLLSQGSLDPWNEVDDVGDVDDDGDLDIVAPGRGLGSSSYDNGLGVFVNSGHPYVDPSLFGWVQLVSEQFSSADGSRYGAMLSDVDTDGLLDVLAWPVGSHSENAPGAARVFRRRSDNSGYEPGVLQLVQPTARLDVDGDGDEDLVATNLHRNRSFEGEAGGVRCQEENGIAGAGGIVPTLGAVGPFRGTGSPIQMRLSGATGGVHGVWHFKYLAEDPPPFAGDMPAAPVQRFIPPVQLTTSGAPGAVGEGRWTITFPVPSVAIGRTKRYYVSLNDPWSPTGVARSNNLFITYGP